MKINLVLILSIATIAALVAVGNDARTVRADVTYSWEYTGTNVYNETGTIFYEFAGLEIGETYRWDLYSVDDRTGQPLQSLGFRQLTPTTTTATTYFGRPIVGPLGPNDNTTVAPSGFQGPVAVVDSNGTILGKHFIASNPAAVNGSGWQDAGGNTGVDDKQVVGGFQVNGFCQNPAAAPINSDGWQHTFIPCSVLTVDGDYAIMHYQIDTTYTPTSDLRIIFFLIPTVDVELTIYIDDILSYQTTQNFVGMDCACVYDAFMIINTSGRVLPFVSSIQSSLAFVTGDNPMLANFDPGVYNYSRNDTAGWVSDGESVWIVSLDSTGNEWSLTAAGDVGPAGNQVLTTHAVTEAVWDSYHGYQLVADVLAGYSNTVVYSFTRDRSFRYAVGAFPGSAVTAQWINRAQDINAGLATAEEMEFNVQAFYDIIATVNNAQTFEQTVNEVLSNTGLDTPAGRAAVLMIILFCGMLGVAAFTGLRGNIYAYLIVWTGLGSVFILGGFGTLLVNTVYVIMTLGMWMFAMLIGGVISENDEG